MLTLFSQIMVDVKFPLPVYQKGSGLKWEFFSIFKLFPVSHKISGSLLFVIILHLITGVADNIHNVGSLFDLDIDQCLS